MKKTLWSLVACLILLVSTAPAFSQSQNNGVRKEGEATGLPSMKFDGEIGFFGKDPFFRWYTKLKADFVVAEWGDNSIAFDTMFQAVGGEMQNRRVNIVGNGYEFGVEYRRQLGKTVLGGGVRHWSTHKGTDALNIAKAQLLKKKAVPLIDDTDLNIGYFYVKRDFESFRFSIHAQVQPIHLKVRGGVYGYNQPGYVRANFRLWGKEETKLSLVTTHEIGKVSLNTFSLRTHLFHHGQKDGRLQPFVTWTPGSRIFLSPADGWVHGGTYGGVKISFGN